VREAYGTGYALFAYPNLLGKKGYVVVVVVVECLPESSHNLLTVPLAGYILLRSYWPEAGEILAMILKSAQIILTLKYRSEKKIK